MQLINNERFSAAFDTFYDRRNAMVFMVSPIGGFRDKEITDEGRPNLDWNPVWNVRTGRFDGGWTVEMEIPFKSLRYQPGTSQLWGLQLGRRIRWKNETAHLTPIPASGGPGMFRVSAVATLTGLKVPSGNRRFEIKPYAIGSLATDVNAVSAVSNNGAGDFTIGALNIHTDDTLSAGALATNFTVIRIKCDILRRSRIGGIFTGRSVSTNGPGSNEVYGLDAAFSFYNNVNFNGYYARSRTPGLSEDDVSYQAAFTYTGDLYALQVDHLLIGDNFNPEIGFLRRDDFRRTFVTAQYSPRPSAIETVRQFTWGGSLDYITNGAGLIETRIAQARFETEFENSDRFNVDIQKTTSCWTHRSASPQMSRFPLAATASATTFSPTRWASSGSCRARCHSNAASSSAERSRRSDTGVAGSK